MTTPATTRLCADTSLYPALLRLVRKYGSSDVLAALTDAAAQAAGHTGHERWRECSEHLRQATYCAAARLGELRDALEVLTDGHDEALEPEPDRTRYAQAGTSKVPRQR